MGIVYQIPRTSRFIPTTNTFIAQFNVPTIGKYDFGIPANTGQDVLELKTGSTYLIDRISIAGTVSDGVYLESIETLPLLTLKRLKGNDIVFKTKYPVVNYIDDQDLIGWVISAKGGDRLIVDLTGVLDQVAAMVGINSVKINVSYSIYAIESTVFERKFRDILSDQTGDQVSGAINS